MSLISRVAGFTRSPQGRRLAGQVKKAASDPSNRRKVEQVRLRLAKRR
jgi:hypothetical protein